MFGDLSIEEISLEAPEYVADAPDAGEITLSESGTDDIALDFADDVSADDAHAPTVEAATPPVVAAADVAASVAPIPKASVEKPLAEAPKAAPIAHAPLAGGEAPALAEDVQPEGPLEATDADDDLLDIFVTESEDILDHADSVVAGLRETPHAQHDSVEGDHGRARVGGVTQVLTTSLRATMSCQPRRLRSIRHHRKPSPNATSDPSASAKRSSARGHGSAPPSEDTTRKRHARMPIVWPPRAHETAKYAAVTASSAACSARCHVGGGCATSTSPCATSMATAVVSIHRPMSGNRS